MTDYMEVADIEQPPTKFWADADAIVKRRKALKEEAEG